MTDPQALITAHLDIWSAATVHKSAAGRGKKGKNGKISLYGIEKLRALILDLAVRGKLVPQDPDDEPASELLKRIKAEKQKLIAEGKIKKGKKLLPIEEEEKPFDLPKGWEWVRLGDVFNFEYGNNLPKSKRSETGEYSVYGSNGIVGTHSKKCVDASCIVIGRKGSAGALNICYDKGCWVTDVAYSSIPPKSIDIDFNYILFKTLSLDDLGKGIKPGLNRNEAYALVAALPPLAEQKRIVARVEGLMALVEALEEGQRGAMAAHQLLVKTLLEALTNSASPQDANSSWARIAENFDTLFTSEASIDQLKQTLLGLAVMGKLTPQNPTDEPASELLKRIKAEKQKLIAAGKIKKSKKLPPIEEEEKPFDLPNGWEWCHVGNLFQVSSGTSFNKELEKEEGEYPYIKVADMNLSDNELWITTSSRFINPSKKEKRNLISENSIVFPKRGGAIATNKKRLVSIDLFADLNIMAITVPPEISLSFTYQWLLGIDLALLNTGTSVPQINHQDIEPLLFPLPPLAEQKRIVARVEALMALCDQLKARISQANKLQKHLADTLTTSATA